jgi:hypothetical protein
VVDVSLLSSDLYPDPVCQLVVPANGSFPWDDDEALREGEASESVKLGLGF